MSHRYARPVKLSKWKLDQDLTNRQLARGLGYAEVYISQLLTGAYPISRPFVHRFIARYGRAAASVAGLLGNDADG